MYESCYNCARCPLKKNELCRGCVVENLIFLKRHSELPPLMFFYQMKKYLVR